MSSATILSLVIPSLLGITGGLVSAWVSHRLRRNEILAQVELLKAQVDKTHAEADQIRAQVKNVSAAVTFTSTTSAGRILYDATRGFDGFDYEGDPFGGAEGSLARITDGELKDGILSLERRTAAGIYRIVFKSYLVDGDSAAYMPAGPAGSVRRIKAEFEARALGAGHTLLLVIKDPDSAPGHHLADWRGQLLPDAWTRIEAFFESEGDTRCRFRIDDQGLAAAPTTLQIRGLVLTAKER